MKCQHNTSLLACLTIKRNQLCFVRRTIPLRENLTIGSKVRTPKDAIWMIEFFERSTVQLIDEEVLHCMVKVLEQETFPIGRPIKRYNLSLLFF